MCSSVQKFFDRKEIRDLLSYLKLILDPATRSLFQSHCRARRGIGPTSLNSIVEISSQRHMGILDAADLWGGMAKAKNRKACLDFCELIYHARDCIFEGCSGTYLLKMIDERIGYSERLTNEDTDESRRRLEKMFGVFMSTLPSLTAQNRSPVRIPCSGFKNFLDNAALVAEMMICPKGYKQK